MKKFLYTLAFQQFLSSGIVAQTQDDFTQTGVASYYHNKFVGKLTACGERFSQQKYTCAHRTLPFGTKVKITNTNNNKSVIAVVNDRGPYIKGRIVDLSLTCAKQLDFIKDGKATVQLEIVQERETADTTFASFVVHSDTNSLPDTSDVGFAIKVSTATNTDELQLKIKRVEQELDRPVTVHTITKGNKSLYNLYVGRFYLRQEALLYLNTIGTHYPEASIAEMVQTQE